ncbi:hypothetical protein PYCCODRAFT_343405 [Trametes coccinea BRFM310]|uniref:Uncharacterized protein n=1 Tax=Trametes coccinea (strain BRFM310) TaxID=1353009 RepID=A0A1Y2J4J3_TRAC3|nr:hypothetical protein PYCCODRAFT_343405 [Trametes coccinea BRFM310]
MHVNADRLQPFQRRFSLGPFTVHSPPATLRNVRTIPFSTSSQLPTARTPNTQPSIHRSDEPVPPESLNVVSLLQDLPHPSPNGRRRRGGMWPAATVRDFNSWRCRRGAASQRRT